MSHEQGPQLPTNVPTTPTTQRVVPQDDLLNSTPFNRGTPTQHGSASSLFLKFVDPLLYEDLRDHQVASFENILKELLWRASTKSAEKPPEDLSADEFCATLLKAALTEVIPLCNRDASANIFASLDTYLRRKEEVDRYIPFVDATNNALEKLRVVNIQELKKSPKEAEQIIFLVNHPHRIPVQSGGAVSHRKPDVLIMRSSDAARAREYPPSQITYTWKQLTKIAVNGVKPRDFRHILSCVEFKADEDDRKMEDFPEDITPSLTEGEVMHIIVDGPEFRAAKRVESQAAGGQKREREEDNLAQPKSTKRRAIAGPSRTSLPRSVKVSQPAQVAAHASGSQARTPQEKTFEDKDRDPILQAGSYATEMLSLSRTEAWNLLILDEWVHVWYYDRQGGIQSHGLDITKHLPYFFVLLLALQRLGLEEWGYAPGLSFNKDNHYTAQIHVVPHLPAGDSDAFSQHASVSFTQNQALRNYWGLVGRATEVYVCDLNGHTPGDQVVKLSWPELTRTPEPEILKELEKITDEEVKEHVPVLLASQIFPTTSTGFIRERLHVKPQPHRTEVRGPRQLVVTVTRRLRPVWDLTADEFFDVWMQCLLCHAVLWRKGIYHRDISPPNIMYYRDEDRVVGVLNDWDLATALSASSTPNTDRTGTVPFMALQLLSTQHVQHLFRHDVESFIWVFLWVCGCSDGSETEVPEDPYLTWRSLDMVACMKERGNFLSNVSSPQEVNVSAHHNPNEYFCLFLAMLLQQLRVHAWKDIPTNMDREATDEIDMGLLQGVLLPKFREVRATFHKNFSSGDWSSGKRRLAIRKYIRNIVTFIIDSVDTLSE